MKLKFILAMVILIGVGQAMAGTSSNVTVTSDYIWRGVTQTEHGAAVQGGMDWEFASGFSIGTWLSNISVFDSETGIYTPAMEQDIYAGYTHKVSDDFSLGLSTIFYLYNKGPGGNTHEVALNFAYKFASLSANYVPDEHFGVDSDSWYFNLTLEHECSKNVSVAAQVGMYTYGNEDKVGVQGYTHYGLSVTRSVDNWDVAINWSDTDRKTKAGPSVEYKDQSFFVAVTRNF